MRSLAIAFATVTMSAGLAFGQSQCPASGTSAGTTASATASTCSGKSTTATASTCSGKSTTATASTCSGKGTTATASTCGTKSTTASACCASKGTNVASCDKAEKAAFMASLKEMGVPMMRCEVGDQETNCPMEANEIAAKLDSQPVYFVGESRFEEMPAALEAWQGQLDNHLAKITTVQYTVNGECVGCPTAAAQIAKSSDSKVVYQVASASYECKVSAGDAAVAAKEAADGVNMTYRVGKKDFCCDKMAGTMVKETGQPMMYVVGEELMDNETQAKILLTIMKITAATNATAPTEEMTEVTETAETPA